MITNNVIIKVYTVYCTTYSNYIWFPGVLVSILLASIGY